jgi:hypothetical protein
MHAITNYILAFAAAMGTLSRAAPMSGPIVAHPGGPEDIIITEDDTVNATKPAIGKTTTHQDSSAAGTANLPFSFVNNFDGGSINSYVTGLNDAGQLVMLKSNGQWYLPTAGSSGVPEPITENVAIPLGGKGSTTSVTTPGFISSGRIWFAEGELQFFTVQGASGPSLVEPSAVNPSDPSSNINWGFVELTNTAAGGIYADISYVDFVGLILGIELVAGDGSTQSAQGLQANAVAKICSDLQAQEASDGQPWGSLCMVSSNGTPLRVLAPNDYLSLDGSAFSNYFTDYINQVWNHYSSTPLTIDTQAGAGKVDCTVSGSTLNCDGDNRGYAKPSAGDIFGCNSGPFAIESGDNDVHRAVVPRLCAAFDRTTLLLSGGNVQPSLSSSSYYTTEPTNYFSKFVHKYEVDGRGYAFAYDDVNPAGEDQAGVVVDANPQKLTVIVGGPL